MSPDAQTTSSSRSSPSALTQDPAISSPEDRTLSSGEENLKPTTSASEDDTNEKSDDTPDHDLHVSPPTQPLYKSTRFKGYLTICLASIVNYNAAVLADQPLDRAAVPADTRQRRYAMAVGLLSAIVTGFCVLIHIDRYSPLEKVWHKAFSPQSRFELVLVVAMVLWWLVAAIVQTSVRGIAGDGKAQYNLFYSTWVCCWTSLWNAERMAVDFGYPTFRNFVTSWPHRAPGWIAIFLVDFFTLWWYIDLFINTHKNPQNVPKQIAMFYENIPGAQYSGILFVSAITLVPSAVFICVEILRGSGDDPSSHEEATAVVGATTSTPNARLRISLQSPTNGLMVVSNDTSLENRQPQKKSFEIILEGTCLLCLALMWIPSVIVVTTPGGFANQVGNAYFCTWATTILVLETLLWFIHDWRKSVYKALQQKEAEYRRHQRKVLEQTKARLHAADPTRSTPEDSAEQSNDDDDDEDESHQEDDDQYRSSEDEELSDDILESYDEERNIPHPKTAVGPTVQIPNEGGDTAAAHEQRLRQSNERAYFDTLDDILE